MSGGGLYAPFPWFGGKRRVAQEVWARFGAVHNYVEPFFGSGAVLLGRPSPSEGNETINDLDGYVANFWRAIKHAPEDVAVHADNPVNENDLHARHVWLVGRRDELHSRLEGDPDYYDARIAGYWVWGLACWIGRGWCSGNGGWTADADGRLVRAGSAGQCVTRQLPHHGRGGRGVNRQRLLRPWFCELADRLRRVRVCSGDWSRVCGPSVTYRQGITAVFLDPPYASTTDRQSDIYRVGSESVAHAVREWAIANGAQPQLRIALCGYDGEHEMPGDWAVHAWKAQGGYGTQANVRTGNEYRERIWFSPACLSPSQMSLFEGTP